VLEKQLNRGQKFTLILMAEMEKLAANVEQVRTPVRCYKNSLPW